MISLQSVNMQGFPVILTALAEKTYGHPLNYCNYLQIEILHKRVQYSTYISLVASIVQIRIHASTNKLIRANFYAISWCGFMPYTIMQLENLQRSIQTNSSLIGQFFRHIRQSHLNFPSETFKNSWGTPFFPTEKFIESTHKQMAAEFILEFFKLKPHRPVFSSHKAWYFVTKIVLTYSDKKLF